MKSIFQIITYNVRSLLIEQKLTDLKQYIKVIKWEIVGIREARRSEFKSGNMFHYGRGGKKLANRRRRITHSQRSVKDIHSIASRYKY